MTVKEAQNLNSIKGCLSKVKRTDKQRKKSRETPSTCESIDTHEINNRDRKQKRNLTWNGNKDLNKDKNELYKMCVNNNDTFDRYLFELDTT